MSAANILLYAVGEEDAWLTGTPSMTYFSALYRHHTPFVTETIEVPFDTPVAYGKSSISTIPARGDVITSIKLKTTHAALYTTLTQTYCWPVWPANIPVQPTVYLLINGTFTPAIQPVPSNVYYGKIGRAHV